MFWWMGWSDACCGGLHIRRMRFEWSYDTAALLFRNVLVFLLFRVVWNNTTHYRIPSGKMTYVSKLFAADISANFVPADPLSVNGISYLRIYSVLISTWDR